jgi:putative transposase
MKRRELGVETLYHVFNRSIAEYTIFTCEEEYIRMENVVRYYKNKRNLKFSRFLKLDDAQKTNNFVGEKLVEIIAYCIMPTHIHFVLQQMNEGNISIFMNNIFNSYTHYFNLRHKRKGPLWESRFKHVLINNDEYLIHLTRYIHLNPVTAGLVEKPELWEFSSYKEYIDQRHYGGHNICDFKKFLDINSSSYKEFVEAGIDIQKEIAKIKHLIME